MDLLPRLRQNLLSPSVSWIRKTISSIRGSKRSRYGLGIALDLICLGLIIVNGIQPATRLISPLVAPLYKGNQTAQVQMTNEVFSFAPGGALNKFSRVNTDHLNTLAYFDLPLDTDGSISTDTRGYANFHSAIAASLFQKVQSSGGKVVVTLTLSNSSYIQNLLDNPTNQQQLINQSIQEVKDAGINGVAVDFEPQTGLSSEYSYRFTQFISQLTSQMHSQVSNSEVAVVVPSANQSSLYNIRGLGQAADRILVMATNFAAPEVKDNTPVTPVYGYNDHDYWTQVNTAISSLSTQVSSDKLVLERAWYGSGDSYPLYTPNESQVGPTGKDASSVVLDQATIDRLVSQVPASAQSAARQNIPVIANALQQEGILNSNVLAYALATIEHETDSTFQPIEEIQGRFSARRLGYEGGENYFGRGFIQLTHLRNYKIIGERIGMGDQLVEHPELASTPEVAAKILAAFFKDNNVANLASRGDFIDARQPINPDRNGYRVAMLAWKYAE